MSGTRGAVLSQKNKDGTVERVFVSHDNVQKNLKMVHFCRTLFSIIAGLVAGIMGLTNIAGFVCYFFMMGMTSLSLVLRTNCQPSAYFITTSKVTYDGIGSGLMTFVLFWTLFYDIVHIYG
mmetsp:Transcript_26784/g.36996  ORF Transcript_26784/g.36996 Transcript_26784/m.36996 type:complete len:121 (-) Transcript_26784:102-464(-)